MNNSQPIIRYKIPEGMGVSDKCLGRFGSNLNFVKHKPYFIIYVDIKRIFKYCIDSEKLGENAIFDQVFSHVFSHEYIHYLLLTHVGNTENRTFDNLFGVMDIDPKYIYSGVKFEGESPYSLPKRYFQLMKLVSYVKITFCHIYTKLINSIKDKYSSDLI